MNEIVNSLGESIRSFRKEQNMTQSELAAKSAISLPSIKKYEKDLRIPKFEQLLKLSKALNVSVSTLMFNSTIPSLGSPSLTHFFHAEKHYLIDNSVLLTYLANCGFDFYKICYNGSEGYDIHLSHDKCRFLTLSELEKVDALVQTDVRKIIEIFGIKSVKGDDCGK